MRSGQAFFCDDLRLEVGNKFSIMGVYTSTIDVPVPFPATISKFCVLINYVEPSADGAEGEIVFKIYTPDSGDEPYTEMSIPPETGEFPILEGMMPDQEQKRRILLPIAYSPFTISKPGWIRVRAHRNGEVVKLGSIRCQSSAPAAE